MKHRLEHLFCALEVRVACRHIVQTKLWQSSEQRQVGVQMGLEAIHAFKSRIDETECHHRRKREQGVVEHGKFIHEIAVGMLVFDCSRIALVGQDFLVDSHLIAEESKLLLLTFKEGEALIAKDEVESNEPRSDVFGRVNTPETDILPADRFVKIA